MIETKYMVEFCGEIVARGMDIDTATTLIKALAEKYFGDMEMGATISLREEPRCEVREEVNNDD